jgi:hypothetical protein
MQKLRDRITYANVMATVALFVALGGVSYAAVNLPKNSVGAKQLKKNSVNSAKVRNGSLTLSDFKRSQRAKLRGAKGATGAPGAPGVSGWQIVTATAKEVGGDAEEGVLCPAGKRPLGGGAVVEGAEGGEVAVNSVAIDGNAPFKEGTGWIAGAHEVSPNPEEWSLRVFAICGSVN